MFATLIIAFANSKSIMMHLLRDASLGDRLKVSELPAISQPERKNEGPEEQKASRQSFGGIEMAVHGVGNDNGWTPEG